jgi:tetratricopeptide (TPR) repeat protein
MGSAVATSVAVAPAEQPVVERGSIAVGDQLAAGMHALETALRQGRGSFLVVTGGRGAGKTTAACELAHRSRGLGMRVARGRCWPSPGAPDLWPWPAIVRGLGDQGLAAVLDEELPSPHRFRRLAATVRGLSVLLQGIPTTIILDDLHHAGALAVELLRLLLDGIGTMPVVIVATYDPTAPVGSPAVGELSREGVRVALPTLDADGIAMYLAAHELPASPADIELAMRVTGGNIGRLSRYAERGIEAAAEQCLAALTATHAQIVRIVAVLGTGTTLAEAAAVVGVNVGEVLRAAQTSGLVDVVDDRLEICAPTLRDAIVANVRPTAEACRTAARTLLRAGSVEWAAELLDAVVAVTAEAGVGPNAPLLVERARAVLACGRLAEARPLFSEAAAAAEAEGDHIALADAALGRGGIWLNEHRSMIEADQVVGLLRKALALLPSTDGSRRLRLEARLAAEEAYRAGVTGPAFELADRARQLDDRGAHAEVLSLVHHLLLGPRHAHVRLTLAEELIGAASEADDAVLTLTGRCWRTVDLFLLGDPTADRMHAALRDRAQVLGGGAIGFVADAIDVMRLMRAGQLDEAEQAAERCLARGTAVGDADALAWYGGQLVVIRWLQGRTLEVLSLVEEMAASPTLAETDVVYLAATSCVAAACGELDRARAALDRLVARGLSSIPETSNWLMTLFTLADAAKVLGDADAAREAYELLTPYADLPTMASLAVVCLGSTQRALGVAALTFGDVDLAVRHLQAAVTGNRRLGNQPFATIAAADLAEALLRRDGHGDRERAVQLLRDAVAEGRRMNMHRSSERWAARADAAERSCGHVRASGGQWTLSLDGDRAVVPDRVGMRYLTTLLRSPGVDVPSIELAGGASERPICRDALLDAPARAAYQRRIAELTTQLDEADRLGCAERSTTVHAELDALVDQLGAATGLGGRLRSFPADDERARSGVTKAIRRALDEIAAASPAVGAHLRETIVTGLSCRYTGAVRWTVTMDADPAGR